MLSDTHITTIAITAAIIMAFLLLLDAIGDATETRTHRVVCAAIAIVVIALGLSVATWGLAGVK